MKPYYKLLTGLSLGFLLAAAGISTAAPRAAAPFSDFAGTYRGTAQVISSGGMPLTGQATIVVSTTPDGASARCVVKGSVSDGSTTTNIQNVLWFTDFKTFAAQDITYFVLTQGAAAVGSFGGSKQLKYNAPFNVGGTTGSFAGALVLRHAGKRKDTLKLTSVLTTTAPFITFTFNASRSVKPTSVK